MLVIPLIERKRDGGRLSPADWSHLIAEYTAGRVPDYQMSALLMACFLKGLEPDELAAITDAMVESGAKFRFRSEVAPRVDKHSTGGVGDKVSIVLAPLVASCGVVVPMMSGRGLGHTGGTLDKLESIPGFRTAISLDEATDQVEQIGCALIGQTEEIAPADRRLYALRDATATIESIPLMAASIMSKKLTEDLSGLVLDVKHGEGAFLPDLQDGLELAGTMIALGEERGCRTVALVTAMDRPLGFACGNALELSEAIAAMHGNGPEDLMEVVFALAVEMLLLAGVEGEPAAARHRLSDAIESGRCADKFRQIVVAQGGDPRVVDGSVPLPRAPFVSGYAARDDGFVQDIDPRVIGRGIIELGGGRPNKEAEINPSVGFLVRVKPGDPVSCGDSIAEMHAADEAGLRRARQILDRAVTIGPAGHRGLPLVSHRVTSRGVERIA